MTFARKPQCLRTLVSAGILVFNAGLYENRSSVHGSPRM